jgi:hypothetical protein
MFVVLKEYDHVPDERWMLTTLASHRLNRGMNSGAKDHIVSDLNAGVSMGDTTIFL